MKIKQVTISYMGAKEVTISETEKKYCRFYTLRPQEIEEDPVSHHILLVDTSLSMSPYLESLKEKVKETLRAFKAKGNQYVSVITYSGHGEAIRILNAVKCDTLSYKMARVYETIDEDVTLRSITVMSEPLEMAIDIVKSLVDSCDKHHIGLFTDGYLVPGKWCQEEEENKCLAIAKLCKEKNICFNAIGFGNYYDRRFLKAMIETSETGKLLHIDEIKDYYQCIKKLADEWDATYETQLFIDNEDYFIAKDQMRYKEKRCIKRLYYQQETLIVTFDGPLKIENKVIKDTKVEVDDLLYATFCYGMGYYHMFNEDIDSAEMMIAETQDLAAYEAVSNTYSFEEKGIALSLIDKLITEPKCRYKKGRVPIRMTLPQEEPLCMLEVLGLLLRDEACSLLWPYHTDYKRIGIKKEMADEAYRFIRPDLGFGQVIDVTIGSKKLNVGVKVKVEGMVEERETGLRLGAHIFRDYNIILNGNLNTETLAATLSKEALKLLRKEKLIKKVIKTRDKNIYLLNLGKLKVTNKRMIKSMTQQEIAKSLYDIQLLGCKEWAIKKIIEEQEGVVASIGVEQGDDLRKRFGLDEKGMYQPKKVVENTEKPYEVYKAQVIEWKIEKFPTTKERNVAYENYKGKNLDELYQLLANIRKEKRQKTYQVNLVRLGCGLLNKKMFLWEQEEEKSKVQTSKQLGINMICGEKVKINTKKIGSYVLRQDTYEIMECCQ